MRLFRVLAAAACLCVLYVFPAASTSPTEASRPMLRAQPGPKDVLYAAPGNANYSYGPKLGAKRALRSSPNAAMTATFQVSYDAGFQANPAAQAAFQAAVDIWAQIVVSPVPIRVRASFAALQPGVLGSAGPTSVCFVDPPFGVSDRLYAAALADKLVGSQSCASANFETAEIDAQFSSSRGDWDFGTSGTGVPNKYNFMTVVLHELGHGLGFYGSATSSAGIGRFFYATQGLPGTYDIFDHFIFNGSGTPIVAFPDNSASLHVQLVGNNLFFDGPNTRARNSGQPGKIEAHNFNFDYGFPADFGFLRGSSYSHVDDVLYSPGAGAPSGTAPNGLMTWALQASEVYTDPGPLVRGVFQDEGWSIAPTCTFSINPTSLTASAAGTSSTIALTTQTGCSWTASSSNTSIASLSPSSGTGSATINYTVLANPNAGPRSTRLTIGDQTFRISQNGTGPLLSVEPTSLTLAAVSNGAAFTSQTPAQAIRLTQTTGPAVSWTATSTQPWLLVANGSGPAGLSVSGSGAATINVSVQFVSRLVSTQLGQVVLTSTNAGNTADRINVTLNVLAAGASGAPIGNFDTPANNTTGIAGSVAVTGWALDDVAVTRVSIWRNPVSTENQGGLVFIGDAVFIDGARPDIQASFPSLPRNTRAGWGYLMLSNFLPGNGNGSFTLHAIAEDVDGHAIDLGTKTITVDNADSLKPFGAIDTPQQGEAVCGVKLNFGWALTQMGKDVPADSSTITVLVDGAPVGHPGARAARSDITTAFAGGGYDTSHAVGGFALDTTAFANGVHTIAWFVSDTGSMGDGIGSRFFTIANPCGSGLHADPNAAATSKPSNVIAQSAALNAPAPPLRGETAASLADMVNAAPAERRLPPSGGRMTGRRGFDLNAPYRDYLPDASGRVTVQAEELDRIELLMTGYTEGYLRYSGEVRPLPFGSHLDPATGTFTWMPGVGFVGPYDLVFVRWNGGRAVARQEVRIVLNPKGSNRVGPQTIIDVPAASSNGVATVGSSFFLSGWAADLDSTWDRGVDTVHVWAYPVNETGQREQPFFLGVAAEGPRPDVAAIYGDRFVDSGYGLVVQGLSSGIYDVAVFAHSTVRGDFAPAAVVRVRVR